MEFPGFIGETYQSRSLIADAEQCVNLYPEQIESGAGKNSIVLYPTPGLSQLGYDPPDGVYVNVPDFILAMKTVWNVSQVENQTWIVTCSQQSGTVARTLGLYLALNLGLYAQATLPSSSVPPNNVLMASSGTQLLIAADNNLYCYNLITGANLLPVTSWNTIAAGGGFGFKITGLDFLDGFFLITTQSALYASAAGDGTSWNSINYINISDEPDGIVGLLCDHRLAWIFSLTRTESYYNAGGVDFPFQRVPQGVMETGCFYASSIVAADESVFWLGCGKQGGPTVYRKNGYTPVRVSNHAIERLLQQYVQLGDYGGSTRAAWLGLRAYAYREGGHLFYVLNFGGVNPAATAVYGYSPFPTQPTTLVFDATTNLWHERQYSSDGVNFSRHLGNFYAFEPSIGHLVSDYRSSVIYAMSSAYLTDAGALMTRWRTAPHLATENKLNFYSQFVLDCEVGTEGLPTPTAAQGLAPAPEVRSATQTLTLQWSDDGGQTWGQPKPLTVGQGGNYKARAIWRRLGKSRDRVFKVSTSDAMQVAFINAYIEMTQGNS